MEPGNEEKRKPRNIFLSDSEAASIKKIYQEAGYSSRSEYMRDLALNSLNKSYHPDRLLVVNSINDVSKEINKIGVNINQIARYANEYNKMNVSDPKLIESYNEILQEYIDIKNTVADLYMKLIKSI